MLEDSSFWSAIGFLIFVLLVLAKGRTLVANALDQRVNRIAGRIDQTNAICKEADDLLEQCRDSVAAYEQKSTSVLAQGQEEYDRILAAGKENITELKAQFANLGKQKITQMEASALEAVRHIAITQSTQAAIAVLSQMSAKDMGNLADRIIDDLPNALKASGKPA